MTVYGPDLSANQSQLTLASVRQAGYGFVTARALSFPKGIMAVDSAFPGFAEQARTLKLPFAAYVLVHTAYTPTATAQALAKIIGDPRIPVMIDLEPDADAPSLSYAVEFWDACRAEGLDPTTLYDPRWYWSQPAQGDLTIRPWRLTASNYGSNAPGRAATRYEAEGGDTGPGWSPYGGLTPTFWQFGSAIVLGSTAGGGTVYGDANAYRGSLAELAGSGLFTTWEAPVSSPSAADIADAIAAIPCDYPGGASLTLARRVADLDHHLGVDIAGQLAALVAGQAAANTTLAAILAAVSAPAPVAPPAG